MFFSSFSITLLNIGKYFPEIYFLKIYFPQNSLSKKKSLSCKQTEPQIFVFSPFVASVSFLTIFYDFYGLERMLFSTVFNTKGCTDLTYSTPVSTKLLSNFHNYLYIYHLCKGLQICEKITSKLTSLLSILFNLPFPICYRDWQNCPNYGFHVLWVFVLFFVFIL